MEEVKIVSRKGKQILEKFSKVFIDNFEDAMQQIQEKAPSEKEGEKIQKALSVYIICEIMEGWEDKDQKELIEALKKDLEN